MNIRSYSIVIAAMMVPGMLLLMFFPPLMPIWDIYVAAVCWCIWDDVFGDGKGIREMEAKAVPALGSSIIGT